MRELKVFVANSSGNIASMRLKETKRSQKLFLTFLCCTQACSFSSPQSLAVSVSLSLCVSQSLVLIFSFQTGFRNRRTHKRSDLIIITLQGENAASMPHSKLTCQNRAFLLIFSIIWNNSGREIQMYNIADVLKLFHTGWPLKYSVCEASQIRVRTE